MSTTKCYRVMANMLMGNVQSLRGDKVKVLPDALRDGGVALKGYGTMLKGNEEALNNNGCMLTD